MIAPRRRCERQGCPYTWTYTLPWTLRWHGHWDSRKTNVASVPLNRRLQWLIQ